jgi:diaminopimelate epimerase
MELRFVKMEGTGNDFVVIDNRGCGFGGDRLAALARQVCPRRTGVGADGLLVFDDADEADYRMRYLNRDGSTATMCGNGARCLALYARHEAGLCREELCFQSDAGAFRALAPGDPNEDVRLYVDPPRRFERDVALRAAGDETADWGAFHYIWPGVEHVVCFVDDAESAPVERIGRTVRRDPALEPAGANFNFVETLPDGGGLRVRTYEKGVEAETPACGTGALAAACVARLLGVVRAWPVAVEQPGGRLTVGGEVRGGEITELYLEGPARFVFRGEVAIDD